MSVEGVNLANINQLSQAVAIKEVSRLQRDDRKKAEKVDEKKFKYIDRNTPTLLKPFEKNNGDIILPFDEGTREFQPSARSCLPTCVYHALKGSLEGTNRKLNTNLDGVIQEMYGQGGVVNDRGGSIEEASRYLRKRGMTALWKAYTPPNWVKEGINNGYYIIASVNVGPMRHAILVYGYNKKTDEYNIFDPNPSKGIIKLPEKDLMRAMDDPGASTYRSVEVRTIALTGPPSVISNGAQGQMQGIVGEDIFTFTDPEFTFSQKEDDLVGFFSYFVGNKK